MSLVSFSLEQFLIFSSIFMTLTYSISAKSFSRTSLNKTLQFFLMFIVFIYFYFLAASGLRVQRAGSSLWHVVSFIAAHGLLSSCGARAPRHTGSVVVACGLSCPTSRGILVSWPGIKPTSPALEGGFFTSGPPGKPQDTTVLDVCFKELLMEASEIKQ